MLLWWILWVYEILYIRGLNEDRAYLMYSVLYRYLEYWNRDNNDMFCLINEAIFLLL